MHRSVRRVQSGDDRGRLHGRVGTSGSQWRSSRGGDRAHEPRPTAVFCHLPDSSSAQRQTATENWVSHRLVCPLSPGFTSRKVHCSYTQKKGTYEGSPESLARSFISRRLAKSKQLLVGEYSEGAVKFWRTSSKSASNRTFCASLVHHDATHVSLARPILCSSPQRLILAH